MPAPAFVVEGRSTPVARLGFTTAPIRATTISLSPQIHHGKPQPWYTAAFNLVLRKQAVTEAIK